MELSSREGVYLHTNNPKITKGLLTRRRGTPGRRGNSNLPILIISCFNFIMVDGVTVREIIWTVGLPHQPGVSHLQVKRPLNYWHSDLRVARGRGTSPKYLFANAPQNRVIIFGLIMKKGVNIQFDTSPRKWYNISNG